MGIFGLGLALWLILAGSAAGQGTSPQKTATATFAGGCFWCVEADFDKVEGVISTTSGYIGGSTANPTTQRSWLPISTASSCARRKPCRAW